MQDSTEARVAVCQGRSPLARQQGFLFLQVCWAGERRCLLRHHGEMRLCSMFNHVTLTVLVHVASPVSHQPPNLTQR